MRGKVLSARLHNLVHGITPAYAGKSFERPGGFVDAKDHPRVCGEKMVYFKSPISCLGSPPRMRGKGSRWSQTLPESGITPAYAGKRDSPYL